jgi:hypothetical protein
VVDVEIYAEPAGGGPVTPLAEAVRDMLPPGRVTHRAVADALNLAGLDPTTGHLIKE